MWLTSILLAAVLHDSLLLNYTTYNIARCDDGKEMSQTKIFELVKKHFQIRRRGINYIYYPQVGIGDKSCVFFAFQDYWVP